MFEHKYSDDICNTRVFLIGPCPPPLGGVTVHVQRVKAKLKQQLNKVYHIDFSYNGWWLFKLISYAWYLATLFLRLIWISPTHLIYHRLYLKSSPIELGVCVVAKFFLNCKIIIVEHNCRHMYVRSSRWKKLYTYIIRHVQLVFIGQLPYKSYLDNSIEVLYYTIEGAFLPPNTSAEQCIMHSYSAELMHFVMQHSPILLMNGSHISFWHDQDVYGFDQMIVVMRVLKELFPNIGLVIMLATMNDKSYFVALQNQIKRYNLVDHVFFNIGQNELWPLLKQVDLFVRPTVCDGASISLQEALYFDTPVVASDVCVRPDGTTVYRQDDMHDLVQKIKKVLKEMDHGAVDQQCNHMYTQQTR